MTTRILVLFLMFTAVAAQAGLKPVYEPKNIAINTGRELTSEQVKLAFMSVPAEINGWAFEEKGEGKIVGTLKVRAHTVVVDILYSAKDYSILYVSSENMKYNAEKKTIHPKYETWIRKLERVVLKNLIALPATTPGNPAPPANAG